MLFRAGPVAAFGHSRCWWPCRFLWVLTRATTLQQLIQQGYPAKNSLSAPSQRGKGKKPWNGHSQVLSQWELRKGCEETSSARGSTPLFFTTTSQPRILSKFSPGMCFPTGMSCILFIKLSKRQGWGKNTDYKSHSKEIKQTLLLQQSTLRGWQREPTFQLV